MGWDDNWASDEDNWRTQNDPTYPGYIEMQKDAEEKERRRRDGALEAAWGIIANVGGGDWTKETSEWQEAAARWRDSVMPALAERLRATPEPCSCNWPGCQGQCHTNETCPCHP